MNPIVEKVYQIGIIPVIAFNSVDEALPLCKALAEGGLPAAEVTFRTARNLLSSWSQSASTASRVRNFH